MDIIDFASFERLTGLSFFTPAGEASAIPLGNVEMLRCDYGLKSVDILRARRGQVYPRKRVYYARAAEWTIQCNQFHSPAQIFHFAGTRLADTSQVATETATFTFTAAPGRAFFIVKSGITIDGVMVGSDTKVDGYDYFADAFNGVIRLPVNGGTIVTGDIVIVNYSYAAQSFENYNVFDTTQRDGRLTVFCEDELGPPAREQWTFDCTLYCKALAETDPSKFRSVSFEACIYGTPTVTKRPQQQAWDEITTDSGAILDLS